LPKTKETFVHRTGTHPSDRWKKHFRFAGRSTLWKNVSLHFSAQVYRVQRSGLVEKDVSRYESKTFRRSKSTMGNAKTYRRQQISAEERRNHPCWTEEAFATHESSLGSKKKSSRK